MLKRIAHVWSSHYFKPIALQPFSHQLTNRIVVIRLLGLWGLSWKLLNRIEYRSGTRDAPSVLHVAGTDIATTFVAAGYQYPLLPDNATAVCRILSKTEQYPRG